MANILLGATGSVAVYKSVELVRSFFKKGHNVRVVLTPSAMRFVLPAQFLSIGAEKCLWKMFPEGEVLGQTHISLSDWADVFVIAPASANSLGKMANGIADNLLLAVFLAMGEKPVIMAPAMNSRMWDSAPVQENVRRLKEIGCFFVLPAVGMLADGKKGIGHLAQIKKIEESVLSAICG